MCRLFGFRSAVLSRAHRSLVAAENAMAVQARQHRDGWGMGYFHGGDAYVIKSEAGAADNESFRRAADRLASHTFVVHVRRATVGGLGPFNVHPFRHGRWLFAHNGTLFEFDRLRPKLYERVPRHLADHVLGTTDTESLFFFLLAELERAGLDPLGACPIGADRLGTALEEALDTLYRLVDEAGCPPPVVNFILTNGNVFVANRSGRELFFATQKAVCQDFATCAWPDKICMLPARPGDRVNHLIVASEKIGDEDRWEELPEGTMAILSDDFRVSFRKPPPAWRPAEQAC
ncbi:MAG: class II glutamine amidotransferase [Myxococcota bacterium]